jgi:L-lactate dehydrogenase
VIPTDGDPVLADFSTATMSLSAAKGLAGRGQRTKTPRFLDAEGRPSDDPSVMDRGGTLLFAGGDVEGHKAYGLSLFCEALAVLAGGSANNPQLPQHQNFCMLVLDPAKFAGKEAFAAEMRRYVAWLKSSRVRPGFQGIRLPGERGFANLRDAKRNGVPLDDAKVAMLRRLAKDTGLTPPV